MASKPRKSDRKSSRVLRNKSLRISKTWKIGTTDSSDPSMIYSSIEPTDSQQWSSSSPESTEILDSTVATSTDTGTLITRRDSFESTKTLLSMYENRTPTTPDVAKKRWMSRLTKAELKNVPKAERQLHQQAKQLSDDNVEFESFIKRFDNWFSVRKESFFARIKLLDSECVINYMNFIKMSRELKAPFNEVQLYKVCQMYDITGSRWIDANDLSLTLSEIYFDIKRDNLVKDVKSYVHVKLLYLNSIQYKSYPGHISKIVDIDTTIEELCNLVRFERRFFTRYIQIYSSTKPSPQTSLSILSTLRELGVTGGSKRFPQPLTLIYDVLLDSVDCPIILSNNYFGGERFEMKRQFRLNPKTCRILESIGNLSNLTAKIAGK